MTEAQLDANEPTVSQRNPRRQRWVPFDADGWPEVAAALPLPWPQSAAAFDLRWHTAQEGGGEVPYGKRFWMKRWGWTDWGVRALLRREGWRDPIHPLSTQDPPTHHPLTTQDPPAAVRTKRNNQPVPSQDPPEVHPLPTQDPPADLHRRVGLQGQGQEQGQGEDVRPTGRPPTQPDKPTTSADRYDEAALYFGEVVHRAIGRRPSQGPARSSKTGAKLLRAVKADADQVLDAMRWVVESPEAAFHRGQQAGSDGRFWRGMSLETVLRHVEEYAERYRSEQEPLPPEPSAGDEVYSYEEEPLIDVWERKKREGTALAQRSQASPTFTAALNRRRPEVSGG